VFHCVFVTVLIDVLIYSSAQQQECLIKLTYLLTYFVHKYIAGKIFVKIWSVISA